jgi:propionate CoA-transferase
MKNLRPKIVSAQEAVKLIKDNTTLAVGGAGAGHAVPDTLLQALGERFESDGFPSGLTIFHPCGIGDNAERGLNHIAKLGLVKRNIGGFWGNAPRMVNLAKTNSIEAYNFPQGVLSHLTRAIAGNKPGVITTTGLHTFVDPRHEGGKVNSISREDLVTNIELDGKEYLFYKSFGIDVAFIRGSYIDEEGNVSTEDEVGSFAMLSLAQAARNSGGIVIAQVKSQKKGGHLKSGLVKIPAVWIDYIVIEPGQTATFLSDFEPSLVSRTEPYQKESLELSGIRKIIARRAAMELQPNTFVNLGYGLPDGVPLVAQEAGITDQLSFMIEQGAIAGIPTTGLNFGAMYNPLAIVDDAYQFDFFHGGGLDICFLGFAQIDKNGSVNASRFGDVLTGCGGFIDISQNTKKIVFCGAFAAKTKINIVDETLHFDNLGSVPKFINEVQQITLNGKYAAKCGQEILYVTERAVFKLHPDGLMLIEIAPGIDLHDHVLSQMQFEPIISKYLSVMDKKCFSEEAMILPAFYNFV